MEAKRNLGAAPASVSNGRNPSYFVSKEILENSGTLTQTCLKDSEEK
jgi:hypothetical protein